MKFLFNSDCFDIYMQFKFYAQVEHKKVLLTQHFSLTGSKLQLPILPKCLVVGEPLVAVF